MGSRLSVPALITAAAALYAGCGPKQEGLIDASAYETLTPPPKDPEKVIDGINQEINVIVGGYIHKNLGEDLGIDVNIGTEMNMGLSDIGQNLYAFSTVFEFNPKGCDLVFDAEIGTPHLQFIRVSEHLFTQGVAGLLMECERMKQFPSSFPFSEYPYPLH